MKAFFSRRVPMYLLAKEEINDSNGFDAYAVEVSPEVLQAAQIIRSITDRMTKVFENNPAPEDCAQKEADSLTQILEDMRDASN